MCNGFHLRSRNLTFNVSCDICKFFYTANLRIVKRINRCLHTASNFVKGASFVDLGSRGTLILFAEPEESLSFRVVNSTLFNYSNRYTRRNIATTVESSITLTDKDSDLEYGRSSLRDAAKHVQQTGREKYP